MNFESIKTQVIGILNDISTHKITDVSLKLLEDLTMDSLRLVMLLVMIEDTFDIELDESDMNPFILLTVQDVVDLVAKYKNESSGDMNG